MSVVAIRYSMLRAMTYFDAIAKRYPGESAARQPVHTVYGGAHLFTRETAKKLGELAMKVARRRTRRTPDVRARRSGIRGELARRCLRARASRSSIASPSRISASTSRTATATRPDAEEDRHVELAAQEVARGPRGQGRCRRSSAFASSAHARAHRREHAHARRVLDELLAATNGHLPPNFVVTFPKIQHIDQVGDFIETLSSASRRRSADVGACRLEIMVEQPQTIFMPDGRAALPLIHDACDGRLFGAHFGTYDYTASMRHHRGAPAACSTPRATLRST